MTETPPPPQPPPDPALQLQHDIYLCVVENLRPVFELMREATPDARARRERVAIAEAAAMIPANAEEAKLAAHSVGAGIFVDDCYRALAAHTGDLADAMKLSARAASMGRESRGYRSLLLRIQALRLKREANDAARESAAWTEHAAHGLMQEAANRLPWPAAPAAAPPAPTPSAATPATQPQPPRPPADSRPFLTTPRPRLAPKYPPSPPGTADESPDGELLDDEFDEDHDSDDDLDQAAD
jgi:hypothetical protein